MKISSKLMILIVSLVLLPSLIIGMIAFNQAKDNMQEQAKASDDLLTREVEVEAKVYYDLIDTMHSYAGKNIKINMDVARDKIKTLCGQTAEIDGETLVCENGHRINDAYSDSEIVKEIKSIVRGHSSIFIKLNETNAKKISTTETNGIYAYGYIMEDSLFEKVIRNGEFTSSYAKIGGVFKTKNCDPIKNKVGDVVGAFCVGIPETDVVSSLISKIENVKFGNNGNMQLISTLTDINYGEFVVHQAYKGRNAEDLGLDHASEIISKKTGTMTFEIDGAKKAASYIYYEPYEWIIVAEQDLITVDQSIAGIRNAIIASSVIFIILGIIMGIFASNIIVKPVKELTDAGNKIAKGDIDAQLPVITSKDEIKDLSQTMDMLVGAIKYLKSNQKQDKKK